MVQCAATISKAHTATIGVVTALPQRLLFTSEVHVACCHMHNVSGAAPVLLPFSEVGEGPTSSSEGGSSTYEVRPPKSFHLVPSWFHPQVPLFTRPTNSYFVFAQLSYHISLRPVSHPPMLDFQAQLSPKGVSHHFHHNIFPLAPSFSLAFWILRESWLLRSAVTTPNMEYIIAHRGGCTAMHAWCLGRLSPLSTVNGAFLE